MRKVKLAQNIGFCSGVKRAIDIVEEKLKKNEENVYSLGPVIHNPLVLKELQKKKLCIINSLDKIKDRAALILPSHGTPRHLLTSAKEKNLKLVDVTCPYVTLVQKICSRLHTQGMKVIIIGDRHHPEIRALMDLAPGALIVDKNEDIKENALSYKKIGIISQTTQTKDIFFETVGKILQKNPLVREVHIYNTICLDTMNRQNEVRSLAQAVDVLLVIGSSTSANTKRLASLGGEINKRTYLVENAEAGIKKLLKGARSIGIISGASTPRWLVEEITKKITHTKLY